MNLDFEIYGGTSFADLCKEVVGRSSSKKDQLDTLISEIRPLIKTANDAQVFLPRIKELLDVGVKNDEQLVKLMAVLQRTATSTSEGGGDNEFSLSEEDKEQLKELAKQAAEEVTVIKEEIDKDISDHLSNSGSANITSSL